MPDFFDVAIPADAQKAAEALGLKVHRNITTGASIRRLTRDEAEIAIECLRDWGFNVRVVERAPNGNLVKTSLAANNGSE
jgi:N6-adenosine-specific RNA methylase IME4